MISSALPALMGPIMSLKLSKGAFDLCFKNQWQMLFMFMKVFSVCEVKLKSEGNKNPTTGVNKDNLIPRVNDVLPPFICVPKQMKTIENLFFPLFIEWQKKVEVPLEKTRQTIDIERYENSGWTVLMKCLSNFK